uniref:Uncharacterized protein n=1 Tax=Micrurus lemniscatus lemniscatus TaxID=129467 RepID=A0A2D4IQ69_MICLE
MEKLKMELSKARGIQSIALNSGEEALPWHHQEPLTVFLPFSPQPIDLFSFMWLSMIPIAVVIPSHSMEPSVRNLAMGSLEWAGSQIGNLSSITLIKCRSLILYKTPQLLVRIWQLNTQLLGAWIKALVLS